MLKFDQIIKLEWESETNRLCSTIIGLSADGSVYKFIGNGWIALPMQEVPRP